MAQTAPQDRHSLSPRVKSCLMGDGVTSERKSRHDHATRSHGRLGSDSRHLDAEVIRVAGANYSDGPRGFWERPSIPEDRWRVGNLP